MGGGEDNHNPGRSNNGAVNYTSHENRLFICRDKSGRRLLPPNNGKYLVSQALRSGVISVRRDEFKIAIIIVRMKSRCALNQRHESLLFESLTASVKIDNVWHLWPATGFVVLVKSGWDKMQVIPDGPMMLWMCLGLMRHQRRSCIIHRHVLPMSCPCLQPIFSILSIFSTQLPARHGTKVFIVCALRPFPCLLPPLPILVSRSLQSTTPFSTLHCPNFQLSFLLSVFYSVTLLLLLKPHVPYPKKITVVPCQKSLLRIDFAHAHFQPFKKKNRKVNCQSLA